MNRLINILILFAAIILVLGIGSGYGLFWRVYPFCTFWRVSMGFLTLAVALILLQIRDKG